MSFQKIHLPLAGLVSAETLSLLGNQVAAVAIPLLVLQQTGSALMTGLAGAVAVLPILLAALVGGRAIDRFGPWRVSLLADVLSGVSVLALPLAFAWHGQLPLAWILLLVFVGALFDPSGSAARQILVPSLARLARQPLERVNALRGGLENGADFAGPMLAVGLVGLLGAAGALYVNAASFLLCALLVALLVPRKPVRARREPDESALAGVRFILRHPRLRPLALLSMMGNFVLSPFLGLLLPLLAVQVHHNTTLLGLCLSAFGICATLGALAFARLSRYFSRSAIFYGGQLCTALAIVLCGLAQAPAGLLAASALAGLLLGAGNPLQQTLLQEETPKALAGQVFTGMGAISFGAGPLGLLLLGVAAQYLGAGTATLLAGGALLISALLGWLLAPLHGRSPAAVMPQQG
ncbi:MFS transporter [Chitinimonas viridis]|uniref:MFS transporter n=1 Tax=Chitinimonas viridis TaxID=664880 RepID=A0ABT8B646_9NEIS|nr:MFS transporter [Chitinimonas viridis]MDN3577596.1 MFS transporter [Chitinimonas viridis]